MKKLLLCSCGFVLLTTFTGCISFFEDLIFNKNGTGHFSRKLDMSEMMEMMQGLKELAKDSGNTESTEEEGMPEPNEMAKGMTEDAEEIKKIAGISNVKTTEDTAKHIYTLEFDFANESALNQALNQSEKKKDKPENVFSFGKNSITRVDHMSLAELTKDEKNKEMAEMMEAMLGDVKYYLTITVPGEVKSVNNKQAEISGDKKKVSFETNMKDLTSKKTTSAMKIDYK